jgi:hypothetical protein
MKLAAAVLLPLLTAACVVAEGPCTVSQAGIVCKQGGRVSILAPSHTIEATGEEAAKIVTAIQENPRAVDPRILTPPRARR